MNLDVQIDQKQLQEILKKADPATVKKIVGEVVFDAAALGQETAKEKVKGGLQMAEYSIWKDVAPWKIREMTAKFYSVMPIARAMSIEEGRPPGEEVEFLQAARFALNRRYLTRRRLPDLTPEERAKTNSFIEKVKAQGVKSKKFMDKAAGTVTKNMPGMLGKAAKRIEAGWSNRTASRTGWR